jgi:hypothetical protein
VDGNCRTTEDDRIGQPFGDAVAVAARQPARGGDGQQACRGESGGDGKTAAAGEDRNRTRG